MSQIIGGGRGLPNCIANNFNSLPCMLDGRKIETHYVVSDENVTCEGLGCVTGGVGSTREEEPWKKNYFKDVHGVEQQNEKTHNGGSTTPDGCTIYSAWIPSIGGVGGFFVSYMVCD
jgi:hypothetical protein